VHAALDRTIRSSPGLTRWNTHGTLTPPPRAPPASRVTVRQVRRERALSVRARSVQADSIRRSMAELSPNANVATAFAFSTTPPRYSTGARSLGAYAGPVGDHTAAEGAGPNSDSRAKLGPGAGRDKNFSRGSMARARARPTRRPSPSQCATGTHASRGTRGPFRARSTVACP